MDFEAFAPGAPYVAAVLVGAFLWRVFVRMLTGMEGRFDDRFNQIENSFRQVENSFQQMESRFENRFVSLETRFESLDKKVDGLAADHHSLSRELSEFRGEMRGRLGALVPQDPGMA